MYTGKEYSPVASCPVEIASRMRQPSQYATSSLYSLSISSLDKFFIRCVAQLNQVFGSVHSVFCFVLFGMAEAQIFSTLPALFREENLVFVLPRLGEDLTQDLTN